MRSSAKDRRARVQSACPPAKRPLPLERSQQFVIALPVRQPAVCNSFGLFQLGEEERRSDLAGQERRADILPRIFVDFAAEKANAIGSLLAHNLGAKHKFR